MRERRERWTGTRESIERPQLGDAMRSGRARPSKVPANGIAVVLRRVSSSSLRARTGERVAEAFDVAAIVRALVVRGHPAACILPERQVAELVHEREHPAMGGVGAVDRDDWKR